MPIYENNEATSQVMQNWVIYFNPSDFPNKYVVRLWYATRYGLEKDNSVKLADTITEARSFVPENLYCLPRFENDDPAIVEVWL